MFSSKINMQSIPDDFRVDKMMRYSLFVPRLYNLCRSLGFTAGKIMLSRAFCSDENQGFPIILITEHFGAFPFNHGQVNTQAEFDRTFRALVKEKEYANKNLFFISCLNIDISPSEGQLFPLTKYVPWAAYIQQSDGSRHTLEQAEIFESLMQQSSENPERIDLEDAIQQMVDAQEIRIAL